MNSILFFTADFLNQVLRNEGMSELLFEEIGTLREQINRENYDAYLSFIFRFLVISGISPLYLDHQFLNPESGIFEEYVSHHLFNESISSVWKSFLQTTEIYGIKLKRDERSDFLDSLMLYCQIHINGFYTPKSLAIVREIFD